MSLPRIGEAVVTLRANETAALHAEESEVIMITLKRAGVGFDSLWTGSCIPKPRFCGSDSGIVRTKVDKCSIGSLAGFCQQIFRAHACRRLS